MKAKLDQRLRDGLKKEFANDRDEGLKDKSSLIRGLVGDKNQKGDVFNKLSEFFTVGGFGHREIGGQSVKLLFYLDSMNWLRYCFVEKYVAPYGPLLSIEISMGC